MTRYSLLTSVVLLMLWVSSGAGASAQDHCTSIAIVAGETAATFGGEVPLEGVLCYRLTAELDQNAAIEVLSGDNIIFSVQGEPEAPGAHHAMLRRQTYTILVGQLVVSDEAQPFRITVSLSPPSLR